MENLIEQIREDHINMSKVLNIMEEQLERLDSDLDVNYNLLVEGMRYMVNYSDEIHHPKEDAIFDRLADKAPEELQDVIDEVSDQHQVLAEKSEQFYEVVQNASLGTFVSKKDITEKGHEYVDMLRQHINLEEGTLFRQARGLMDEADLSAVEEQYAHIRDPLLTEHLLHEYESLYRSVMEASD